MADIEKNVLIDVNVDNKDARRQLEQTTIALTKNKQEIVELRKAYDKGEISIEQYAKETTKLKLEQQKLTDAQRTLTKEVKAESNSIDALRLNLAKLTKERNALNTSTAEGAAEFNRLQGEIKSTSDQLSALEQAGGDFRRNVGNYPQAVKPLTGALKSVDNSAKELYTTLLANPFTAIAAALVGLFQIIKRNDEASVAFVGAQKAVGIVLDRVADSLVENFKAASDFFSVNKELTAFIRDVFIRVVNAAYAPLKLLIEGYKSIVLLTQGEFKAAFEKQTEAFADTGKSMLLLNNEADSLGGTFADIVDETIEATKAAQEYSKALDEIEEKQSAFGVLEQQLINQRDRLRLQAKDLSRDEEDRIALLEKADKIDEEILNRRLGLIQEEIDANKNYLAQTAEGSQEREDTEFRINELLKEQLQAENERLVFQEKAINQRNKLLEKQREELEKTQKAEAEMFNKLDKQFEGAEERRQEILQRNAEADNQREQLALQRSVEIERNKLNNTELTAQQRVEILQSVNDKELELLYARQQAELESADLTASERLLIEERYAIERERLAEKTQKEIDKVEKEGAVTKQQVEQVKGQAVAGFFSLANTLAEGNKSAEKAIGIGQAIVNTAVAVTKALATYGPTPVGFAAAGAAVTAGAAQVVKISKAAGGGSFKTKGPTLLMVGDNPGGVEHVQVTPLSGKGKTEIHSPNLIAMAGGGSLTAGSGIVTDNVTSGFSEISATQKLIDSAMKKMPAPVVSVKEINRTQKRVTVKEKQNL